MERNRRMTTIANTNGHPEVEGGILELNLGNESGRDETAFPQGPEEQRETLTEPQWNGEPHIPESWKDAWREHLARQASEPMIMSAEFEAAVAGCGQPKSAKLVVAAIVLAFLLGALCASALVK
jgi:hypothetical protein